MSVVPGPASQDAIFKLVFASPALQRNSSRSCSTVYAVGWRVVLLFDRVSTGKGPSHQMKSV